jgi:hypothetical protein
MEATTVPERRQFPHRGYYLAAVFSRAGADRAYNTASVANCSSGTTPGRSPALRLHAWDDAIGNEIVIIVSLEMF